MPTTKTANDIFSMFYLPRRKRFVRCFDPSSAFLQYKSFRINLLNGRREESDARAFLRSLEEENLSEERELPKVLHLFYEFGYLAQGQAHLLKENIPLAITIEYTKSEPARIRPGKRKPLTVSVLQYPEFKEYKKKFSEGMERLLAGDCYQFNLTCPFFFELDSELTPAELINKAWSEPSNIGAYAHCTYLGTLNKLFLSNSPECLFQYKESHLGPSIYSMPIKGTSKVEGDDSPEARAKAWKSLGSSAKDQAELYMITDLVRNDLTRTQMNTAKVRAKKLQLNVPGIVHQYSLVEAPVSAPLNLRQAVEALFPGGSITGAPKKKVMDILSRLEGYERGFYCGSTVILHKDLKAASINIRSCEVDCSSSEMKYCSGGGITLNSDPREEFEEVFAKMESFLHILKD